MEGDDKRYAELKATIGDNLFAAYDPLDMKAAKYLIVASSDYLYKPRSLFWPDVIFLKLDWGQSAGMTISMLRVVSMEPQVIVIAGSNDHLQSRGLLSRLRRGDNDISLSHGRCGIISTTTFHPECVEGHLCVCHRGTPYCQKPFSLYIRWSR